MSSKSELATQVEYWKTLAESRLTIISNQSNQIRTLYAELENVKKGSQTLANLAVDTQLLTMETIDRLTVAHDQDMRTLTNNAKLAIEQARTEAVGDCFAHVTKQLTHLASR